MSEVRVPVSVRNADDAPLPTYAPGLADCLTAAVTRPADTTAYAIGDLLANSTTAASVTALEFASAVQATGRCVRIDRVRLRKSGTSIANASFRLHIYSASPGTPANGDNGAFSTAGANYVGALDVTVDRAFTDGAAGAGLSLTSTPMLVEIAAGTTVFGLLEARGAYTPASAEVFTVTLEAYRF